MAFMLPALGGLLGSMLFKADGGKIGLPEKKSAKMENLTMRSKYSVQPVKAMYPHTQMYKKGGKIKKKKDKK